MMNTYMDEEITLHETLEYMLGLYLVGSLYKDARECSAVTWNAGSLFTNTLMLHGG